MPNDIRDFLNQVKSKGIARPNMFRITGDIGPEGAMNARNEAIMCRSASIPSMEEGFLQMDVALGNDVYTLKGPAISSSL